MATKKRTTPLKAKTARRTEPKRKATCPVAVLARQVVKLGEERNAWYKSANDSNRDGWKTHCHAMAGHFADRMRNNRDAASYLTPKSADGAAFLALSAFADVGYLTEANPAEARSIVSNRLKRSLHALMAYFEDGCGVSLGGIGADHYDGEDDPRGYIRGTLGGAS